MMVWPRLAIGILGVVGLYMPAFPSMVLEWATFPNLSHGFAVPVIAVYLVWTRRGEIAKAGSNPSWLGIPLVAAGLTAYIAGSLGNESFLARVSLPLTLLGSVTLISGWQVGREMAAGIGYLFFMVPAPYVMLKGLTDRVRLFDAAAAAWALPWLGVPVLQDGYFLHLPNITLEVADVCSSIPAIVSFLALAAALAYVNRRPPRAQAILILSAVPFGLLSNMIRIILTAVSTYIFGRIALDNVIHMSNGTTVFLMTLGLLLGLDAALLRLWPVSRGGERLAIRPQQSAES
jgi:exosortase